MDAEEFDESLSGILEPVPAAVWILSADGQEMLYRSQTMDQAVGVDQNLLEDDPKRILDAIHPDDIDAKREWFEARTPTASVNFGDCWFQEYRLADSTGTYRLVTEITFPLDSDEQTVAGWASILFEESSDTGSSDDRTQAQMVDEAEQDRSLTPILDAFDIGICEISVVDNDVRTNDTAKELFGYEPQDTPDNDVLTERIEEADLPDVIDSIQAAVRDGESFDVTYRVRIPNGRQRWINSRGVPRYDDGRPIGVISILTDVTDRKQRLETLELQADQLGLLNQIIRHDIRNEVDLGTNVLQVIRREANVENDDVIEYVDRLAEVLDRVGELTETARDMTDVITTFSSERTPVTYVDVLRAEIANASTLSDEATITIDGDLPDVPVLATEMLSAVFRNILKNAIQHNDTDESEVRVSAVASATEVTIRFADNGPGIPDEKKEQIFESGQTLVGSTGTGFGLSLITTLVEQYDGSIAVEDNTPKGSVFVVTLKRADNQR